MRRLLPVNNKKKWFTLASILYFVAMGSWASVERSGGGASSPRPPAHSTASTVDPSHRTATTPMESNDPTAAELRPSPSRETQPPPRTFRTGSAFSTPEDFVELLRTVRGRAPARPLPPGVRLDQPPAALSSNASPPAVPIVHLTLLTTLRPSRGSESSDRSFTVAVGRLRGVR